ncbi:MAG: helix-turn-helix domain-containing protein [Methylotenera sp.]|nr:helix-turn-helix domain-containing protein [Methylotenera sp.]
MIPNFFNMLESLAPDHSVQYDNHQVFADDVSGFGQSLNAWEPLDKDAAFSAKLMAFQSDDVALAAFLFPKIRTEVGANETHNLAIPLLGHNISRTKGKDFAWGSSTGALYSPAGSNIQSEEGGCLIGINFDPEKLRQTIQVMLCPSEQKIVDIDFETTRVMPKSIGRLNLTEAFKRIFHLAAQSAGIPDGISRMGCDDMVYRHLALMFYPSMVGSMCADAPPDDKNLRRRQIDDLCDFLMCRLEDRVSITDMERQSGLSARTLQNSFLTRFGVSPVQWLRQQRLDFSRQTLLHASLDTTVIDVALASGFTCPSKFAMYYKQRFGESPSATLAKVLTS